MTPGDRLILAVRVLSGSPEEPGMAHLSSGILTLKSLSVERVKGIEPSPPAWEAGALPLCDTRMSNQADEINRIFERLASQIPVPPHLKFGTPFLTLKMECKTRRLTQFTLKSSTSLT